MGKNRILSTNGRIISLNNDFLYVVWMDEYGVYHVGELTDSEDGGLSGEYGDLGAVAELISAVEDTDLSEVARLVGDPVYAKAGLPGRKR